MKNAGNSTAIAGAPRLRIAATASAAGPYEVMTLWEQTTSTARSSRR